MPGVSASSAGVAAVSAERPWSSVNTVLLELVVERPFTDPEQLCRAPTISSDDLERVQDRVFLELGERSDIIRGRDGLIRILDPDVRRIDDLALCEDRRAFENISQLAHVAAPARREEALLRGGR